VTAALEALLVRTSRTFALSIPLLPAPLREQVTVAYLLFRVADTLEDGFRWERDRRLAALDDYCAALRGEGDPMALAAAWRVAPPCNHPGYLELLDALPALLGAFAALDPSAGRRIAADALRTAEGMRAFVARASGDGALALRDRDDLRNYCYVVAGIVGELLTALFQPGAGAAQIERAVRFGEGLQLVNILKDAAGDAAEGRVFLPPGLDRAEVFALARADLVEARRYVEALRAAGAHRGVVAFCALPALLAEATLDRVERCGAGAKLDRARVAAIAVRLDEALADGGAIF